MALLLDPLFLVGLVVTISAIVIARTLVPDPPVDSPPTIECFSGEVVDDFPPEVLLSPGQAIGKAGERVGEKTGTDRDASAPYRIIEEHELL